MALTYTYPDAYLRPLITEAGEQRAQADVLLLGSLPDVWAAKLTVLRAYVLTCLESQQAPDDLFSTKLGAYRKEYDTAAAQARMAQAAIVAAAVEAGNAAAMGSGSPFSVSLERA